MIGVLDNLKDLPLEERIGRLITNSAPDYGHWTEWLTEVHTIIDMVRQEDSYWRKTMTDKTCHDCIYGTPFAQDITKLVCRGMPPQIITAQQGVRINTQTVYPLLPTNTPACGFHKSKVAIDSNVVSA